MPQQGTPSYPGLPVGPERQSPTSELDLRRATQGRSWQPQGPESVLSQYPDLADATRTYLERGRVKSTERAHKADWQIFLKWCKAYDTDPLPASVDTVTAFLADMAKTRALATLHRYKGTITKVHGLHGFPPPTLDARVRAVMHGIAVEKTTRSPNAKAPATANVLGPMIGTISGDRGKDLRDRAILLLGAVTGMRGAEISAVNVEDLTWHEQGLSILIRRSKTDQTGHGRYVAVPCEQSNESRCAAHAIRAWLDKAPAKQGPLFRSFWNRGKRVKAGARLGADQIADIVKEAASAAGLDPHIYGAHSLRSGYVTQARREGLSFTEIMEQTGHRNLESVRRYARDPVDPFRTGRVREVARAFARAGERAGSSGDPTGPERTGGR